MSGFGVFIQTEKKKNSINFFFFLFSVLKRSVANEFKADKGDNSAICTCVNGL